VDVSTIETNDPLKSYDTVNKELSMYNQQLIEKPQIVVLNKLDLPGAQEMATSFHSALKGKEVISISALTGKGIEDLTSQIIQLLDKHNG
jgi:GTP-binding protein